MTDPRLRKWQLGLGVLGLITFGLLIFVIIQGVNGKQDRVLFEQVSKVADKLNNYIDSNQKLPENLAAAGITDAPSAVDYTKQSSGTYEFCVTWHSSNSDVSAQVAEDLGKATTSQGYGESSSMDSTYTPALLYVSPNHKAGRQCQTVKPYIFDNSIGGYNYPLSPSYNQ